MSRPFEARGLRILVTLGCTAGLTVFSVSCAAPTQSISADPPRSTVPLPACIMRLPPRGETQRGFMRQLTEPMIWKAVFPTYEENRGLESNALACTGEAVMASPELTQAQPRRPWPFTPQMGDVLYGSGPKRTKVVWLRTHQYGDGSGGGVLALVRAEEDYAEVFGVGVYQGSLEKTRLATERVADTVVITVIDDGCMGKTPEEACESWLYLYSTWSGTLAQQAKIAVERRRFVESGEQGAQGPIRYRLVSSPQFQPQQVRLLEQITAVDSAGRTLRTVELERSYRPGDGGWVESQPSVWEKIVPGSSSAETPAPSTPSNKEVQPVEVDLNQTQGSSGL